MKSYFRGPSTSPEWSENEIASNSGRLVLRHQPARKVSRRNYRPNRIPALPSLAGKHVQLAINLIAPEGLVAKSFGASVDADRSVFGLLLPIDPSSERT